MNAEQKAEALRLAQELDVERPRLLMVYQAAALLRTIAAEPQGEPVAWRHELRGENHLLEVVFTESSAKYPFGKPGIGYSKSYEVTSTPLYLHTAPAQTPLTNALHRIASLDPETDSNEGYNEWGEAHCFRQAHDIAREALQKHGIKP